MSQSPEEQEKRPPIRMPEGMVSSANQHDAQEPKITVAGVTFGSSDVVEATVEIEGRKIVISKPEDPTRKIGFKP